MEYLTLAKMKKLYPFCKTADGKQTVLFDLSNLGKTWFTDDVIKQIMPHLEKHIALDSIQSFIFAIPVSTDDNDNKCLIDKEDYDVVKRWYWRKVDKRGNINKGYWITNVKIDDKYNKSILGIHQLIAEIKYGEYESSKLMPDHLSRNTDDNRKCNIILKSNQKNTHNRGLSKANTSGKTGVSFMQDRSMWCA